MFHLKTDSGRIIYIVAGPGHVDTLRPFECFNEVGIGLCKKVKTSIVPNQES